jgi:hypothetical protein
MLKTETVAHALRERGLGVSEPPTRPPRWRLSPRQRKAVLAAHLVVSVGSLGIYAAMLLLGTAAAATAVPGTASAAYRAMGILKAAIPPAAGGVLITGVILALGTSWGLFKHYWVVAKLVLTGVILPLSVLVVFPSIQRTIAATARATALPAADLGSAPLLLIAASGAIVLMLGAATFIAVYKPWGMIARRRRPVRDRLPDAAPVS